MATETGPEEKRAKRSRGSIRAKGPNSFQVRVRAGTDPVTGKPLHVHGSASTEKEVQKLLTRLLHEADTERAASTQASLGYLLDRWLPQHDVDETTRSTYESLVRNHIRPPLGAIPLSRLTRHAAEIQEKFYSADVGRAGSLATRCRLWMRYNGFTAPRRPGFDLHWRGLSFGRICE